MGVQILKRFSWQCIIGIACGCLAASAQDRGPDYFPLEVGNTWLYKATTIVGAQPLQVNTAYQTIRVIGTERIGDTQYFRVSYFGRDVLLREDVSGNLVIYDQAAGTETSWVALGAPVGVSFPSKMDQCSPVGKIVSRTDTVAVPLGSFKDEIQVGFTNSCADAGLTTQHYAPNVGLIRQEQTSFAGPVVYRLIYYHVGDHTGVVPEVSFTVAVDSPVYIPGNLLGARLTLRNSGTDGLTLHFPSGQSFDLKILNDKGQSVYTWSADKSFIQMTRDETLAPGELTYGTTVPLAGMAAGRYVLQAYLTTDPIVYSGQVAFEVIAVPDK